MCTRAIIRPWRRRDVCRRRIRTCRTSRSGLRKAAASAMRSSRPPGRVLVAADYSQIELRIMAHLSRDERLLEAFRTGTDVHRATAGEILGVAPEDVTDEQRRAAKAVNFGLIYGMSAFGLGRQLGIERAEAQDYVDRYFARYPRCAGSSWTRRKKSRASAATSRPCTVAGCICRRSTPATHSAGNTPSARRSTRRCRARRRTSSNAR